MSDVPTPPDLPPHIVDVLADALATAIVNAIRHEDREARASRDKEKQPSA